jgi:hypothetical protein
VRSYKGVVKRLQGRIAELNAELNKERK